MSTPTYPIKQGIFEDTFSNLDSSKHLLLSNSSQDINKKLSIQPYNTHKVFIHKVKQQNKSTYNCYLPGYLRIKIKNFTQMDLQKLTASMNATLIFTVYYGHLKQLNKDIVEQLLNNMVVLLQNNDPMLLKQTDQNIQIKVKHQKKDKQITYTIRKIFRLRIQSDVFWSPFQIINLIFSVTIQPILLQQVQISLGKNNYQTVNVNLRVNLMDHQESFLKVSYTQQGAFGYYELAEKKLRCIYSYQSLNYKKDFYSNDNLGKKIRIFNKIDKMYNKQIDKQNKKQHKKELIDEYQININRHKNIENYLNVDNNTQKQFQERKKLKKVVKPYFFQYAHFNIPLYKYPGLTLATIFIPLYLLSCVNLGIFFQDPSLSSRIGSLATLMIAFVGLIPVIRQQIPPNPTVLFIQYLVYLQSLTCLFVFIDSMDVRELPEEQFNFIWYEDGLFLAALAITLISMLSIPVLLIVHKYYWEPNYNIDVKDQEKKGLKFKTNQWQNQLADYYFGYFKSVFQSEFVSLNSLLGREQQNRNQMKENQVLQTKTKLIQVAKRKLLPPI